MDAKAEGGSGGPNSDLFSIREAPREFKVALLKELGFDVDASNLVVKDGVPVIDPYLKVRVSLDNMVIVPGSTIFLDDNPFSIGAYLVDHPGTL